MEVDQNSENFEIAYNMLTGIRFTVSRTNAKVDRELTPDDFSRKYKFNFDSHGNELTPSTKYDFKFKDYSPWVFRHLRRIFKQDPSVYLMSLTSKYILTQVGSPGKSGSFFYFSRDYRFIIKTIHHSEHKFLQKILKQYYEHVKGNPNTLLTQFCGLHRVKGRFGRKIHFVVMNNLFPPHLDIHITFDLKGSTVGRELNETQIEQNPRRPLKDVNWKRRNMQIELGPNKRVAFLEQLEQDVEYLKRMEIMDYSLLLGIHDLTRGNDDQLRNKQLKILQSGGDRPPKMLPQEVMGRNDGLLLNDNGGIRSTYEDDAPGNYIYYLGVIDCLTHVSFLRFGCIKMLTLVKYGFIKHLEHFIKGLSHPKADISAVPPDKYGDRFLDFVVKTTQTLEHPHTSLDQTSLAPTTTVDQTLEQRQQKLDPVEEEIEEKRTEARANGTLLPSTGNGSVVIPKANGNMVLSLPSDITNDGGVFLPTDVPPEMEAYDEKEKDKGHISNGHHHLHIPFHGKDKKNHSNGEIIAREEDLPVGIITESKGIFTHISS
jgi:1-phosphatidylinositol-4-phosphate 5-kinase